MMKSIFDQWYDDNYLKKLKHHDSYWKCKQSWLAAQKQQLDETNTLRAKVAELQSSHDALEAKLAKYQSLEPVGEIVKGEAGTMRHPVWKNDIYPDVGCKLYALEMK